MKKIIVSLSFILSLMLSTNLYADYSAKKSHRQYDRQDSFKQHFKSRVHKQKRRIDIGCDEGWLTARQAAKIQDRHHNLYRIKRDYWADGYLSRGERRQLNERLDRISKTINDYKQHHYARHHRYNYDYDNYGRYQQEGRYRDQRVSYDFGRNRYYP